MLFHPYRPVKARGITIWPQGMIPRHRERLAQSIGNAVGNELVSQETVFNALFETSFFQRKVEEFVASYTEDLLSRSHPSFIEALPAPARAPILDAVAALQHKLAEYIAATLKSESTAEAIEKFVDRKIDELMTRRLDESVSDEIFDQVLDFTANRFQRLVKGEDFEANVREFVSARIDELAGSNATLAETFTPETVAFIKERIDQQVPPIVHNLADIATSPGTRRQVGALIKHEVDDYYQQLSLFKKIFISRERIHREVDELMIKTLPQRIEDYLRGPAFAQEAEAFLNSTIDNVLSRPLNEIVGQLETDKLDLIKRQLADRILEVAKSPQLNASVTAYIANALAQIRPQTLGSAMEHLGLDSAVGIKRSLSKSLYGILAREDTARTINLIMSSQIERLMVAPIGTLGEHIPEESLVRARSALVERITLAARERLPATIAEFDVGGLVRKKVSEYPVEQLEALVLSVAAHHLKTIEIFGAVIGFFIGVGQTIYFWITYDPQ